jgi:hypothetical protein
VVLISAYRIFNYIMHTSFYVPACMSRAHSLTYTHTLFLQINAYYCYYYYYHLKLPLIQMLSLFFFIHILLRDLHQHFRVVPFKFSSLLLLFPYTHVQIFQVIEILLLNLCLYFIFLILFFCTEMRKFSVSLCVHI